MVPWFPNKAPALVMSRSRGSPLTCDQMQPRSVRGTVARRHCGYQAC